MSEFNLLIYASDHQVFEGKCQYLNVPTTEGQYGILAKHRNTISLIEPGKLTFRTADGKTEDRIVSRGLLKVENGEVLVLVETAEKPEEIDINRAKRAEELAKSKLKKNLSNREYNMIYAKLARAFSRVHAKEGFGKR